MVRMQTLAQAREHFRVVKKSQFEGVVTELFDGHEQCIGELPPAPEGLPGPQSFLVEQAANWTLPTHFHLQNQFQVFIAGAGALGKHAVEPVTIHYASAHSGYGPLQSGDQGISYFTLRARGDVGAWYLPEAREQLNIRIKKRQAHATPTTRIDLAGLMTLAAVFEEMLIAPDADGMAVWLIRLPPNSTALPPAGLADSSGRFYVVSQGALSVSEVLMSAWATVFVSPDEALDLTAGPEGVEVFVLQFPRTDIQRGVLA
jgi:hypothetical protein